MGYLTILNRGGGACLKSLNTEGGVPNNFECGGGGYLTNLNREGEVPNNFEWGRGGT